MSRISIRLPLCAAIAVAASLAPSNAQSPAPTPMAGTWTGKVAQNAGQSNYSVIMTIAGNSAETDYPELKCGGKLTRVGASGGYVFYYEKITRGGQGSGGSCIDGTVTVTPAGDKLAWGWVGAFQGKTFVGWSTLTRK